MLGQISDNNEADCINLAMISVKVQMVCLSQNFLQSAMSNIIQGRIPLISWISFLPTAVKKKMNSQHLSTIKYRFKAMESMHQTTEGF